MDADPANAELRLDPGRRQRRERVLLAAALLALAALIGWERLAAHRQTETAERARLALQARAIEDNLRPQLAATYAALQGLRHELAALPPARWAPTIAARLGPLGAAMPGAHLIDVLGTDGRVLASTRPALAGVSLAATPAFRQVLAHPDPTLLYLSRPFQVTPRDFSFQLSVAVFDAVGRFVGVVSATLDQAYFSTLLGSVLYAPDMQGVLAHGDGIVMSQSPPGPPSLGARLDLPGSFLTRHLHSGQAATVLTGRATTTGDLRMVALRTLQAEGLPMDRPLVLAVSRDLQAMYARWQRQTTIYLGLYALLALTAWGLLLRLQRRRAQLQRLVDVSRQQQAVGAERFALALRGADLALWDITLPNGRSVVNERWYSMLGMAPGDIEPDDAGWQSLLHPDDRDRVVAAQKAHIAGETAAYEATYRLRHRDGHWVWVLDRGRVVERDADGGARRIVGTHLDISERMQAEDALRRSEQSLAITLYSIGDAVIATDPQGVITRLNAIAEQLLGWSAEEVIGQPLAPIFRIFNASTREPVRDPVALVLERGEIVGLANDTVLIARDGSERQISDSAAPIRDAAGRVLGVVLVFSDVSERYRMTQALRLSEARIRGLLDALTSGVVVHAPDTQVLDANPAACRILGLTLEQIRGKAAIDPAWRFIEEDHSTMPPARYPVNQVRASGQPLNNFLAGVLGGEVDPPRWLLCNAFPLLGADGALQQVVVTFADITERKRAQEELQRSETRLRMAGRLARLGGWRLDLADQRLFFSEELGEILEFDAANPIDAESGFDFIVAEQRDRWRQLLTRCVGDGEPFDQELDVISRRGRPCHLRVLGEAVRDVQGHIVSVRGAAQDITERMRSEAAVRTAQDELAATLQAVPDLLFDVDLEGRIHNYHSPRVDLLYVPPEQLPGSTVAALLPAEAAAVVQAALGEAHEAGHSGGRQYELPLPQGRRWFELSVARKATSAGAMPRFIVLARDITDRKQSEADRRALERQLREAQKLESIGTLAGGIAHDFNNILAAILGNVALARGDLPQAHAAQVSLDQINKAGLRARSLVQQILTFSRSQRNALVAQPLRPVVEESLALLRATLPASVRLDTVLPDQTLTIEADATQLQQVVINLCTNAWHALPEGRGRIEVGCEALADAVAIAPRDDELPPGPCVHLWVRDNGIGMDAATQERIFDPFFTTKPVGQGTGLGLSVVHGIVRGHHGAIRVDSEPGAGSTFHLYLPRMTAPDAAGDAQGGSTEASAQGSGEQVLYVDDDEVMVLMVQRLLQRAGYDVATCGGAAEALALVRADPARFAIVVSDYNMPETSGLDLAAALVRLRPGLPLIITSGYVTDELRVRAAQLGVRALLKKENSFDELAALVHRVLAAPSS